MRSWLALGVGLLLTACGYRFTAGGAPLPEGIREVKVPVFANHTGESAAELMFTQSMREQTGRAGTEGNSQSEARIEGDIRSASSVGALTQMLGRGPAYRLVCTVRLKLWRGTKLVSQTEFSAQEDYSTVIPDILALESARAAAFQRLSDRMMQEGYERLASGAQ